MRNVFFLGLVALLTSYSAVSFADQDNNICEANPSAPHCAQATPKTPDSLPENYSLESLISNARSKIRLSANEVLGQENCQYENSKHVAYRCELLTSHARRCEIELLQIWERADYRVKCAGRAAFSVLVNPGPVPATMD